MAVSSNGSNARRVYTNKVATIDEGRTKKARVNAAATAYAIVMAKRRADANVVVTASKLAKKKADSNTRRADTNVAATANKIATAYINIMVINARAGANIVVTSNTNKASNNTKECVPTYWQLQMPI